MTVQLDQYVIVTGPLCRYGMRHIRHLFNPLASCEALQESMRRALPGRMIAALVCVLR